MTTRRRVMELKAKQEERKETVGKERKAHKRTQEQDQRARWGWGRPKTELKETMKELRVRRS